VGQHSLNYRSLDVGVCPCVRGYWMCVSVCMCARGRRCCGRGVSLDGVTLLSPFRLVAARWSATATPLVLDESQCCSGSRVIGHTLVSLQPRWGRKGISCKCKRSLRGTSGISWLSQSSRQAGGLQGVGEIPCAGCNPQLSSVQFSRPVRGIMLNSSMTRTAPLLRSWAPGRAGGLVGWWAGGLVGWWIECSSGLARAMVKPWVGWREKVTVHFCSPTTGHLCGEEAGRSQGPQQPSTGVGKAQTRCSV
jgi:hypothetical protein